MPRSRELGAALRSRPMRRPRLSLAAERRIAKPASAQEMIFGDGAAGALRRHAAADRRRWSRAPASMPTSSTTSAQAGQSHDYGWEERWVRDEGY